MIGIDIQDEPVPDTELVIGDAADESVLESALAEAGELPWLVCAAGLPPHGEWNDVAAWDAVIHTDLTAPFHALRLTLPALRNAGGAAVLVGSIVGAAEGSRRSPAYATAKAGLEGLARSLALIGAPEVRVNVVAPGAVDTTFDPPAVPAHDRRDIPLGRMGTPEEIAALIVFLLSPAASYISGSVLRIDGGRTIASRPEVWG